MLETRQPVTVRWTLAQALREAGHVSMARREAHCRRDLQALTVGAFVVPGVGAQPDRIGADLCTER